MPHYIVKLKNMYMEYSTQSDAPTTSLMPLDQLKEVLKEQTIKRFEEDFKYRIERADRHGTSRMSPCSAEDMLACNRAGADESKLSVDELYEEYLFTAGPPLQLILDGRLFCSADANYDYFDEDNFNVEICFMVDEEDYSDLLHFIRLQGPYQALCHFNRKHYFMEQIILEGFHIEKSVEGIKVKLYGRALDVTSFTEQEMSHD